jgi:hypothetical protein
VVSEGHRSRTSDAFQEVGVMTTADSQAIIRDCWIAIIQEKTRLVLSETRMQRLEHKLWWADMDRRISAFERHQAA